MKYTALCATLKDETPYLKEWIAYHALIGFEHFILYDNKSVTPVDELVKDFVPEKSITIIRNDPERTQKESYEHCLSHFGDRFGWIAFLDGDEFIRLAVESDIRVVLSAYEEYAALGLHWRMFSWNEHETRPVTPVIEAYTRYIKDDKHIKSIVQPKKIGVFVNPHAFLALNDSYMVNTAYFPIAAQIPLTTPQTDIAWINHYYYKSRQCFNKKIIRGNPCHIERSLGEFESHTVLASRKDSGMLRYVDRIKGILKENRCIMPENFYEETKGSSTLFSVAEEYLKLGKIEEAQLCLCHDSLRIHGAEESNYLCLLRGQTAFLQKRFGIALKYFHQALQYGANVRTYTWLSHVMIKLDRSKEAQAYLEIANFCIRELELSK